MSRETIVALRSRHITLSQQGRREPIYAIMLASQDFDSSIYIVSYKTSIRKSHLSGTISEGDSITASRDL